MGGSPSHGIHPMPVGKVIIITGGNTGVGFETAKSCALMGAKVILAVRTEERGQSAIAKIKAEFDDAVEKNSPFVVVRDEPDIQYRVCDLSSLQSVKSFIDWFKSTGLSINVLICNAGTYSLKESNTEDGYEATYQVTYLSHFLLVSNLLPIICHSGDDCRIVFITSQQHHKAVFDVDYASSSHMKKYNGFQCYANCNLFQIMHMYTLDKVLEKHPTVDVLCSDRGKFEAMAFPNDSHSSEGFSCAFCCMKCCGQFKNDANGAETTLYAALDPNLKGLSRGYFLRPRDKPRWPSRDARKKMLQDYLWKCTIENLTQYLSPDALKLLNEI